MIFGIIEIVEQTYRCRGKQVRPFCESAGVKCRGYSMKVQRESVDFAADQSYEKSGRKMREHLWYRGAGKRHQGDDRETRSGDG
jgi:hypothetical protein